jgi:hypothetical protein
MFEGGVPNLFFAMGSMRMFGLFLRARRLLLLAKRAPDKYFS